MTDTQTSSATGGGGGGLGAAAAAAAGDQGQQQQQQQQQQQPNGGDKPWYGDAKLTDDDRGWLDNKKYGDLPTLVTAARGLEKLVGHDKLPMPKDENDAEALDRIFKRLGRPEDADKYDTSKVKVPEGLQILPTVEKGLRGVAHKLGLSQSQFSGLFGAYVEMMGAARTSMISENSTKAQTDMQAVETELGAKYPETVREIGRVAAAHKLSETDLDAIGDAIGHGKAFKLLAALGAATAEDTAGDTIGARGSSGKLTPAGAQARIEELKADEGFKENMRKGDAAAQAEWNQLHQMLAAGAAR